MPRARLRTIAGRGEVWVVDPRHTETAQHATRHVPVRPGTDHALLAHLVPAVLRRGIDPAVAARLDGLAELGVAVEPWDLERTAATTGIDTATIQELVAAVQRAGRIAVLTGTGVTMSRSANVSEWLALALLLVTDSFDQPGGMWVNPGYLRRMVPGHIPAVPLTDGQPGPASRPDVPRWMGEHPCAALTDESPR